MTAARGEALLARFRAIVGRRHVLTDPARTRRFSTGYRFGGGAVFAVVRPGSLVEQWRAFTAAIEGGCIVIAQAANTGLTGGSTPDGDDYDRPVVILSTTRIKGIHLIDAARQVICLPGARLHELETMLAPHGRAPHSVIGSSCIGASVLGGICNSSGGALIQRGPAFTQRALWARVTGNGAVELVNHLGVRLGASEEEILDRLEHRRFDPADIEHDPALSCSDPTYRTDVRRIDEPTPARFNANPDRLFEAAGSAGRIVLFAVRLDTFPAEQRTQTFYIGTNDPDELTRIRRHMLAEFEHLPVQAEYMHRGCFDVAERYGRDTFMLIRALGTARLPLVFAIKGRIDAFCARWRVLPPNLTDRVMQAASRLAPRHLPEPLYAFRDRFEHHLMLRMADGGIEEARAWLQRLFPSANGDFFECTADQGTKAFLHRFAAAGAAVRYRAVHGGDVADIVAVDMALPRNNRDWVEQLPDSLAAKLSHRLYCGHFFCQVFHQDYVVRRGHDPVEVEHEILALLDARGAEYPAEHNVGHLYKAKPTLAAHYRALDPCNCLNPGIGHTSKRAGWMAQ